MLWQAEQLFVSLELCNILPDFSIPGTTVCAIIPNGNYSFNVPCDALPPDFVETCNDFLPDGKLDFTFEDGNVIIDLGALGVQTIPCTDILGSLTIHHEKGGNFNIENSVTGDVAFAMPCPKLLELILEYLNLEWFTIWTIVKDIIIKPLAILINCQDPAPYGFDIETTTDPTSTTQTTTTQTTTTQTTTTQATTTTVDPRPTTPPMGHCDNISDYDNVPAECFCDGLTMTDTPSKMIFSGAHSGVLLALHKVLSKVDLSIFFIESLKPFFENVNLAVIVDDLLDDMGLNLIDLKHGKFGFFRGPGGSNATRSWWKINSGKYQLSLYNQVTLPSPLFKCSTLFTGP